MHITLPLYLIKMWKCCIVKWKECGNGCGLFCDAIPEVSDESTRNLSQDSYTQAKNWTLNFWRHLGTVSDLTNRKQEGPLQDQCEGNDELNEVCTLSFSVHSSIHPHCA